MEARKDVDSFFPSIHQGQWSRRPRASGKANRAHKGVLPRQASSSLNGYKPNSQEAKLLSVEEEIKKQQKRLIDYQLFMKSFEDHKELLIKFIELAPNNATGIEAVTRHYVFGEKWWDIARKLNYSEPTIYSARKRLLEDLTLILAMSL